MSNPIISKMDLGEIQLEIHSSLRDGKGDEIPESLRAQVGPNTFIYRHGDLARELELLGQGDTATAIQKARDRAIDYANKRLDAWPAHERPSAADRTNLVSAFFAHAILAFADGVQFGRSEPLETRLAFDANWDPQVRESLEQERRTRGTAEHSEANRELARAHHWSLIVRIWKSENAARLATQSVIRWRAEAGDKLATDERAAGYLQTELAPCLERVRVMRAVGTLLPDTGQVYRPTLSGPLDHHRQELWAMGERDGMFEMDARVLDYIKTICPPRSAAVEKMADSMRAAWVKANAQQSIPDTTPAYWVRWADPLRLPSLIAQVLWQEVIQPRLDRERNYVPSLPLAFVRDFTQTYLAFDRAVVAKDDHLEILNADGTVLATTPALPRRALEALQKSGTRALLSVAGQTAFRHFVTRAHAQDRDKTPSPNVLRFEGGKERCAKEMGLNSHKALAQLDTILDAGRYFERTWLADDGKATARKIGGLWLYDYQAAAPGRKAMLTVTLAEILMPFYAIRHLPKGLQWLQPVTPMPPPFGKNPADWGAQAAFQTELVGLLLDHRVELHREGGAKFQAGELERAANTVGLDTRAIGPLLDHWTADHDGVPAVLDRTGPGRWHLARNTAYQPARDYLDAAGKRSVERSRQAKFRAQGRVKTRKTQ